MIHVLRNARVVTVAARTVPNQRKARELAVRRRGWLGAALVVSFALLVSWRVRGAPLGEPSWSEPRALVALPTRCPREAGALAHARALEQRALSRRARIPFALREAPRAIVEYAEAELCFARARDLEGRARTRTQLHVLLADLERRYVQARLSLFAELRERAHDHCTPSFARSVATLELLLERASSDANALRRTLEAYRRACVDEVRS